MKLNMIYILIIAKITLIELTEIAIRTKKSQKNKNQNQESDTKQEYNLV